MATRLPPRSVGEGHWVRCAESCGNAGIAAEREAIELPATLAGAPACVEFRDVRLSYHAGRGFLGLRRSRFDAVKAQTIARCGYNDYATVESQWELVRPG